MKERKWNVRCGLAGSTVPAMCIDMFLMELYCPSSFLNENHEPSIADGELVLSMVSGCDKYETRVCLPPPNDYLKWIKCALWCGWEDHDQNTISVVPRQYYENKDEQNSFP